MAASESLLSSDSANAPSYDPVVFNGLTGELKKLVAFHIQGAVGPSSVDACSWCRMCSSFGCVSVGLCNLLAAVARHLCVQEVIPRN